MDTLTNYCVDKCKESDEIYCQGEAGLLIFAIHRQNTGKTLKSFVFVFGMIILITW